MSTSGENPHFRFSPIVERPRLVLPGGARVAVWVGVNVEHYPFGQRALSLADFTADLVPDPLNHAWRDYGPRVGIWRLSRLLDELRVPVTAITNAAVVSAYPQIVEEGLRRGWCWVAHGRDNATWQVGMSLDEEREAIAGVARDLELATGRHPRGWLGPALTATPQTARVLADQGFSYVLDWGGADDQPFALDVGPGRLCCVPYSSEINDIPAFVLHHQTAEAFARTIVDQVLQLAEETAPGDGRVLGIGLHPFLSGQAFRARHLAAALREVAAHPAVWLTTSDELAERFLSPSEPQRS